MSLQPFTIEIAILTNLKIIGNINGTVFDYKNKNNGVFNVRFTQNKATFDNFNFIFNKCTFQYNHGCIFRTELNCYKSSRTDSTSIVFNDCNFYDNTVKLVHAYHRNDMVAENFDCSTISFKNCNFINNYGLFYSFNSQIYFDNCYISKLDKYSDITMNNSTIESTFYAQNGYDYVNIKNSIFENINIKGSMPLIEGINLKLDITNTTFTDCYSNSDYLFYIKSCNNVMSINVKNSTFSKTSNLFRGNYCGYNISDSVFKNIAIKNTIPVISDSAYSHFTISNTEFKDLKYY
ncbi:hypothetical protein PIROE2DRAFT_18125 [Piromyces sp. E2]|nr:hypothetical protein PIROE2DRAFT_18125 [Piromyces sp. E2]|eukprot:OUM57021.1 hypothetical protein PIROE2DRAFT_18125 [Piromyces sp. E2]